MVRSGVNVFLATVLLASPSLGAGLDGEEPAVVYNQEKGLWDRGSAKRFELTVDLVIGANDDEENEIFFGRLYDVALDAENNIYVLDNSCSQVFKFDNSAVLVQRTGRAGEGPGEIRDPMAIAVDAASHLYVAGDGKICIFDARGDYIKEFRLELAGRYIRELAAISDRVYVSCFDVFEQKVIHVYSVSSGRKVASFCDSYAVGQDVDVRIEQTFGGGTFSVGAGGLIYFSQNTPYLIRTFSADGVLVLEIHRQASFFHDPEVELSANGSMKFGPLTSSTSIVVLNASRFINSVKQTGVPGDTSTILDLFDGNGHLLTSKRVEQDIIPKCLDSAGRLYATDMGGDSPTVVRYRVLTD